jgi:hypothetical protein
VPRQCDCGDFRRPRSRDRSLVWVYAHHVPGRLRLKLALSGDDQDDQSVLNAASRTLLTIPAVISACPNFLTGSVVIRYDSLGLPPGLLCNAIHQVGFSHAPATESVVRGASLTERVADAAIGKLFEYVVESLALAAIAAAI